jgi:type II secretory pathway pseudopilin PulG
MPSADRGVGVVRPLRRLLAQRVEDRAARPDDEGFGLIELIVAMLMLIIVLVPTCYLFTNVLANAAQARERLTALSVAEQWIETLNSQGPPSDANGQPEVGVALSEPSSTLSGISYAVSATFKWTDATGGTPDFCSTDTSPVLGLQVTVSWASNQSISDQAILNFPASGNLTDGYLAIQVEGDPASAPPSDVYSDPWSSRVTNVPVQVSGSNLANPYSLHPSSDGCTFLALAPGTYSVQVGPGPTAPVSYVANYNEASSETQALANQSPITVTDAEITEVVFQYDEGSDVPLAYPSTTAVADGVECPNRGPLICLVMGQSPASAGPPNTSPQADGIAETSSGWSVASFPASLTRIEGVACTTGACIAVGYSSSGGAAAVTTNGTTWTTTSLPAGVSQLSEIVCPPSATTPACIAIGSGTSSNGVLLTATISGSTVTWTKDTIPSTTSLGELVCPSSSAQPVCYVSATTSSGAIVFSNSGSGSPGTTWTSWTAPSGLTVTSISQLVCNSTTFCVLLGVSQCFHCGSSPEIIQLASGTWTAYTNSTGVTPTTFTQLACASSGTSCWATGTTSSSAIAVYLSSGTTWKSDTGIPSGTTSLSGLTCPGSGAGCFSLYATSSSAGVISIGSGTAWSTAGLPSNGAVSLDQLTCPTTTACYAVGTSSTSAIVDVLQSGSWANATFTGTTGGNPVYITDLDCTGATTCVAAGATETAGQVLTYANSTTSFSGSSTPTSLSGLYIDNPPIMVSNSTLQPNSVIEMAAPTTANGPQTEVGPLFPFEAGYSVAPGYCASELTTASSSATTVPGASPTTSPAAPTVILPMGLLPIQAVSSSGVPISGATVTIADASCTSSTELTPLSSGSFPALSNPPANPSNPTSYSMPSSGADGLSRMAVIYGTYQVTVKLGGTSATTTVTVNPTSIVVGSTTYYMPTSVQIAD